MGIFDLFSSDSGQAAAAQAKQAAVKAAKKTYKQASQPIMEYGQKAVSTEQQALPQWQTIFGQGTSLAPTYFGASGVGTPEQIAGAQQAWQSSIPYQQYQAGLPDIYETSLRRGGLTGQTGQIPIDLNARAMQSLNQFYQPWQNTLNPYSWETAGATGLSNAYGNIAGLYGQQGSALSNLASNKGNAIGAAQSAYPANVYAAQQGAASNQLNALFGLGSLGIGLLGGGGGLSGLFGGGGGNSYNPSWPTTTTLG